MPDLDTINSDSYWNYRFAENWEACEGPTQSRFFARIAVEHLPRWFIEQLKRQLLTLADWGCAQGDGTDVWASYISSERIVGVDFSSIAIQQASERYPAIRFINKDWLTESVYNGETFDVVFSSNTLEHFHKPYDVLHAISGRANKAVVLALPYKELARIDEHFYTFLPENIPLQLPNGFRLIHSQVVDCRLLPKTLWSGDQIILIYADPSWLDTKGLTLSDCHIEQLDFSADRISLNVKLAERNVENASLAQLVIEREAQNEHFVQSLQLHDARISALRQSIIERDAQNTSLTQLIVERDAQNASLTQSIVERDSQNASHTQSIIERDAENESLTQLIIERDAQNSSLTQAVIDRDVRNSYLTQSEIERDAQHFRLSQLLLDRDAQNVSLSQLNSTGITENSNLTQLIVDHETRYSRLTKLMADHDTKYDSLAESIGENSRKLQLAENYIADKEIYITQLLIGIEMRDRGLTGILWKVKQRFVQLQHYFNRARQIVLSGGFVALIQAFKLKAKNRQNRQSTSYVIPVLTPFDLQPNSGTPLQQENIPEQKAFPSILLEEFVIFAGVPFDDIGGGQRSAQLARCALKSGRKVIYIYVYPKFDFDLNKSVESDLKIYNFTHLLIDNITPLRLLEKISSQATILIEFPHPKIIPFLNMAKCRGVRSVFELIDDWESSLGGDWFSLDVYRDFVARADVVIGTAKLLVNRLVDSGRTDAMYLPNAANEYIFDKYKTLSRPSDFPTRGKRSAIYFGSLYGEWFAWDYVIAAASQNEKLDIILIGDNPKKLDLPNNIYCLGSKLIEELPAYLLHSDVAILPFVPGKISDAVSPIKVFEYLFLGKPVVSTQLPEIQAYPGVFIADNPNQFAELCGIATATDEVLKKNDIFISQNSWFNRLDRIIETPSSKAFAGSVSAIILIHNNANIIERCLETLIAHGTNYLLEIIVVDNASSDGGAELIKKEFPTVRVIRNAVNGCSSGRNLGVNVAQGKYLAFFDSDQWFTCSIFFQEALSILERNASIGVIGWAAGWFDKTRADLGGMIADYCPNRAMNNSALMHGYRADVGYLGTGGFFTPRSVFDVTDGFDTYYDPTCFEDTDLSFQIKKLGLKVCYRDLTGIRHQPHQTTNAKSQTNLYSKIFNRNSEYFRKKWIDYPDFYVDYAY